MAYFAKFTERGQRALLTAQREAAQLGGLTSARSICSSAYSAIPARPAWC